MENNNNNNLLINYPFIASTTIKYYDDNNENNFISSSPLNSPSNLNNKIDSFNSNNSNNSNNLDNLDNSNNLNNLNINHTWSICHHTSFLLRSGQNYSKNQEKSPSPPSIMNVVGVDIIRTENRIDHIASFIQLNSSWLNIEINNNLIPSLFIINAQIPENFTTSFFSTIDNGPGWSLVMYYKLTDHTITVIRSILSGLSDEEIPCEDENLRRNIPAIKLFMKYCMEAKDGPGDVEPAKSDTLRGRFKVVVACNNIDEFGLPSFITSYNAKPVLIKSTGTLIRGDKYIEMDINIHKFNSMAKKALEILISRFQNMMIDFAFCIESRDNDELPETVLGCVSLNKPTPEFSPVWRMSDFLQQQQQQQQESQSQSQGENVSS